MITADEFEVAFAERSSATVEEIRALGRVVKPCDGLIDAKGNDHACEGWVSVCGDARNKWDMLMSARHQNLVSDKPIVELRFQMSRACETCGSVQLENRGTKYYNQSDWYTLPLEDHDALALAYRYVLAQAGDIRALRRHVIELEAGARVSGGDGDGSISP